MSIVALARAPLLTPPPHTCRMARPSDVRTLLGRQDTIPTAATMPVEELIEAVLPNLDRSFIGTSVYVDADKKTRKPVLRTIVTNTFDGTSDGGRRTCGANGRQLGSCTLFIRTDELGRVCCDAGSTLIGAWPPPPNPCPTRRWP